MKSNSVDRLDMWENHSFIKTIKGNSIYIIQIVCQMVYQAPPESSPWLSPSCTLNLLGINPHTTDRHRRLRVLARDSKSRPNDPSVTPLAEASVHADQRLPLSMEKNYKRSRRSWTATFTVTLILLHIRERDIWRLLYWVFRNEGVRCPHPSPK